MGRKGKDIIYDSFEDKRVLFTGLACLIFLILQFFTEIRPLGKFFPPLSQSAFLMIAGGVFAFQIFAWVLLRHFRGEWYRYPLVYLLFLCEFGQISFSICLASWLYFWVAGTKPGPR